jgi:hypothetical protein
MKTLLKVGLCGTLISLCMLFTNVNAQEQETSSESKLSTKFGIKGGINLSNLYADNEDVEDENTKLGLNVGLFAKIPVFRGLSIQPELLYSGKGAKISYDNILAGEGEYRFNLHYVEAPISAVINLARNLSIHGGVYAAYLVSANITDINGDGTIDEIKDLDTDNFNRFDVGLLGGVALDIQNLTIGARYTHGLNVIAESFASDIALGDSKNSVISLYIGFGF